MNDTSVEPRIRGEPQPISWPALATSVLITYCGFYAWAYTFTNFTFEELGAGAAEISITRSLTSIPGVLAFAIGGLLIALTASRAFFAGFLMLGGGLVIVGAAPSWVVAAGGAVAVSFGQVILYTITNKIGIFRGEPEQTTVFLGRLKSYSPIASIATTLAIFFATNGAGLRLLLTCFGVLIIAFGIWVARSVSSAALGATSPAIRFRRGLSTYYALNFIAGFRSQLFRTYVFILLVSEYAFPVERVAAIHLAGTLCGVVGYRLIGHLAARFGGANVLSTVYFTVALLFAGFATITNGVVLALLFLLDSLLFSTSVVTDAHLRGKASSEFAMNDLGTGVSLFHAAGFVAPLLGGLALSLLGSQGAFYLGIGIALLGIAFSRRLV